MAEDPSQPDVARFDREDHNVTCCLEALCCGKSILVLGEDEAELTKTCWGGICTTKKRGPYGELGTVDSEVCCCFYGFAAASLMPSNGDSSGTQCIGCGCDHVSVDRIVAELKKRQQMRGDRAKVRMAETTVKSLKSLHQKVDMIMDHLNLEPPAASEMER